MNRGELFRRDPANPILTAAEWPYPVHSVFNPGATKLKDGRTLLLCRCEDHRGISHFCKATSDDGISGWQIDRSPTLQHEPDNFPEELWGIEDPRITYVPELDVYVIAYTAFGKVGPGVALATTKDFVTFERLGLTMQPDDKDAALFPRRFDDNFLLVHRPISADGADLWITESPDLKNWGRPTLMLKARKGAWWDANKVGLSPPPIETSDGWLILYHGVRVHASGSLYRVGAALFDLETPHTMIRRGPSWIMGPEASYERMGDVSNVVFPCGYTLSGDTIFLYYGAADTSICLAIGSIRQLLDWLWQYGEHPEDVQLF